MYNTSPSTIEVNCTPAEVQYITVSYWSQQHSSWSTTHHCQLLKWTALQLKLQHITVSYWSQQHSSWSTAHHCQHFSWSYSTSLWTIEVNSTPAEVQHITVNYKGQLHPAEVEHVTVNYLSQLHSSWSITHHCQLLKSTALQLQYNTSLSTIEVNCTQAEVQHITVNCWNQEYSSWSTTHHYQILKSTALLMKYGTSLSNIEVNSTPAEVQHITVNYWSQHSDALQL